MKLGLQVPLLLVGSVGDVQRGSLLRSGRSGHLQVATRTGVAIMRVFAADSTPYLLHHALDGHRFGFSQHRPCSLLPPPVVLSSPSNKEASVISTVFCLTSPFLRTIIFFSTYRVHCKFVCRNYELA